MLLKQENIPAGDVEGHNMGYFVRGTFIVFENGEVATGYSVGTFDFVKSASFVQYSTWAFGDGSTIIIETSQGMVGGTSAEEIAARHGKLKSLREQVDSRESRGLKELASSIFHRKNGKLDKRDMETVASPILSLPSDS